jgi:hypothetical protein
MSKHCYRVRRITWIYRFWPSLFQTKVHQYDQFWLIFELLPHNTIQTMHHQFWENDLYVPEIIELWLIIEQVHTIRIGPITFFMGYSQNHISHKRKHINIFQIIIGQKWNNHRHLVEHINKISFGQKIFICNDIISEITYNFQIVVGECIVWEMHQNVF